MSLGMDRGAPWLVHGHRRKGEDQRQLGSRCGGGHSGSPFWTLLRFLGERGTEFITLRRCWELDSRGEAQSSHQGAWASEWFREMKGDAGGTRAPSRFLTMNLK